MSQTEEKKSSQVARQESTGEREKTEMMLRPAHRWFRFPKRLPEWERDRDLARLKLCVLESVPLRPNDKLIDSDALDADEL